MESSNPGLCDVRQQQRADNEERCSDSQRHTRRASHVRQSERPQSAASELAEPTVQHVTHVDADHADDERCDRQAGQTVHQATGRRGASHRLQVQRQADCSVEGESETDGRDESTDEVDDHGAVPDDRPLYGGRLAAQPRHQRR